MKTAPKHNTKTATNHTPGPWRVWSNSYDTYVEDETGHSVAFIIGDDDHHLGQQKPNADLIAAAPGLLVALQEMCETFGKMFDNNPPPDEFESDAQARAVVQKARATLANARGES